MSRTKTGLEKLSFDFSLDEAHELAAILELLLFNADRRHDLDCLEQVHAAVCDEIHLARWKRENVKLELTMNEIVQLNKWLSDAGGSTLAQKFQVTGELRCCLIATAAVDRAR